MLELRQLRALHLQPLNLTLSDGECVAIQGPSGCGKSMLLRAVADLDPHHGDAAVDGHWCSQMAAPAWRRQVALVPAESGWWDEQVRPHFKPDIDLPAGMARLDLKPELADGPVQRLSTGERQRLALLRALSPGVRVLLLDEPTSGLDAASAHAVEGLLQEALGQGVSILLVTHSAAQVARLASRRFCMHHGHLIQEPT